MWREDKIMVEIREHLGTIAQKGDMNMEVNLVSWNGREPKIDIRPWDEEHKRMGKGIVITDDEAKELLNILKARYEK